MLFLFLIASCYAVYTYVGETPCSTLTSTTCTTSSVQGIGYCTVESGSCITLPCYMIDEVAACRTGGSLAVGAASGVCDSLETFSLQFDNVCCDKSEGKMNYALVRFTKTTDGSSTLLADGTAVAGYSISSSTMFNLYTANPWKISLTGGTFQTDLTNILTAYKTGASILIQTPNSHPFYLERIVYQSLQLLRDYTVLETVPATALTVKQAILPLIWSVALIGITRMTYFQPNYYQTNYYFINFAIIPYSRLSITMNGQMHTTKIDWSSYSYTTNGFLMVYSYPPEQFGIRNAYSDVICLRPQATTTPAYVTTQDNYDTNFKPLTITWYWTDTSLSVVATNLKLFQILDTAVESTITQVSGVTFTCVLASRYCTSSSITGTPLNTGMNYYISTGIGVAADKNKVQCRLAFKSWNSGTSLCS